MKIDRQAVWNKYSGRCAYCGDVIPFRSMQVDHIIPKCSFHTGRVDYDVDDIRNLNPSCRFCNNWKLSYSVERFREELSKQVERGLEKSANLRMALRYNQVKLTPSDIVFHFEEVHEPPEESEGK